MTSSMDLTPLQKQVTKMLMASVGSMELSDLQNLAASMIGRMMHKSGNAEAVESPERVYRGRAGNHRKEWDGGLMSAHYFPKLIIDSDRCGYSRDDCSITYRDFDMPTTGRSYIIVGCPDCGYIERIEPLRQIPSHGQRLTDLLKVAT